MLTLYVAPEDIQKLDDGRVINHGGRTLRPEESPTGKAIEPGSTFKAPESWYESRRHWHFLTVKSKSGERTETEEESLVVEELRRPERSRREPEIRSEDEPIELRELEAMDYRDLQAACKDLGLSAGGSTNVLIDRLAEFYGIATDEEE